MDIALSDTCHATFPGLQVLWNSSVLEAYGNEKGLLGGMKVKNVKTGEVTDIKVRDARHTEWQCSVKLLQLQHKSSSLVPASKLGFTHGLSIENVGKQQAGLHAESSRVQCFKLQEVIN